MIRKTDNAVGLTAAAQANGVIIVMRFGSGMFSTPELIIYYL
jgi:hypothetical protein